MNVVKDEHGRPLPLIRRIGNGGQAEVWASEGRIAVKIMHARTARARERLRSRVGVVKRLDLNGLPVSRPLDLLAIPAVGYSMELLEDMVPIQRLAFPPEGDLPAWYAETGGLRRRLRLLAKSADAFAALHAKGIVYADPSPANVLVSDTPRHEEIRLVDVDLLQSESVVIDTLGTPGYAAPELATGSSGVTNATDAYAFAVIAFQVLTLVHPFLGEAAQRDAEAEKQAYEGALPWIDHSTDESNRTPYGLRRDLVLSPALRKLAQRTFEVGLQAPRRRPTIAEWRTSLRSAADATLACSGCPQSNSIQLSSCPWCGAAAPDPLIAFVEFFLPGMAQPAKTGEMLAVPQESWLPIVPRTAHLDPLEYDAASVAWLLSRPDVLVVRNCGPAPIWLTSDRDPGVVLIVEPQDELGVPAEPSAPRWTVGFGPPGTARRTLRFFRVRRRSS